MELCCTVMTLVTLQKLKTFSLESTVMIISAKAPSKLSHSEDDNLKLILKPKCHDKVPAECVLLPHATD